MSQYIELEEEFEKWKIKTENDISQKNLEIGNLRKKLKLMEQPVTSDSYVQVPDEISFLPIFSDSSCCKSSSISSIVSTNEIFANMNTFGTNDQTCYTSEFPLSNNFNGLKQNNHIDDRNLYNTDHIECPIKIIKGMNQDQKVYYDNSHGAAKTILAMKEKNKEDETEFKSVRDVMKGNACSRNSNQRQMDLNIFQNLKVKLYAQERKKRHLQRYIKQQRQYIDKLLQRKSFIL